MPLERLEIEQTDDSEWTDEEERKLGKLAKIESTKRERYHRRRRRPGRSGLLRVGHRRGESFRPLARGGDDRRLIDAS